MNIKQKLTKLFEYKFDRIYIIHLLDYKSRWDNFLAEIDRVGIKDCKNLQYFYDCKYIFDNDMHACISNDVDTDVNKLGIKKLTMNHYRIVKESKLLGYNRILIIEDDIRFLKDLNLIYNILFNMPDTMDICLFDKTIGDQHIYDMSKNFLDDFETNKINYIAMDFQRCWSTALYSLTSAGMDYIINNMENLFNNPIQISIDEAGKNIKTINYLPSDTFTNKYPIFESFPSENLQRGFSILNLAVQISTQASKNYEGYSFLDINLYNIQDDDTKAVENENIDKIDFWKY